MTIDARSYLKSIRSAELQLQLKRKQVSNLRERLSSISVPMDKEVVSHTPNVGVMADIVAMIVDMETEINKQSAEMILREGRAYELLNMLEPDYSSLLIEHYIKGKRMTEISKEHHLELRWAKQKVSNALAEFQKILDQQN